MSEKHVTFLRNEPKSKVELLIVKDGWLPLTANGEDLEMVQDAYVIRVWSLRAPSGEARVNEIRLRASEMSVLMHSVEEK